MSFFNKGEKSAFVDLNYPKGTNRTSTSRIGFYVYNTNTKTKVFDMSQAEKVLLPQSAAQFNTLLLAQNGTFKFRLEYSNAMNLIMSITGVIAMLAFFL